ncbi:putative mfs polyamine protein [Lasiodiplodia theobromae]|uniref:Efflux pump rdc3 n=2 Tax=Lasiodiplodia theobromae TaxID=45133 RepID=A0A5N5D5U0_9PEZI|nr:Efflux pump rdc3 [Lasiodiplodia theobromae]KAF9629120.1 putative mfs polyamine protein [Lasiodiplodia theobromae]
MHNPLIHPLSVFSTSATVPATPILMLKFSISRTVATLPLTLYALGLAFGPLFTAPLSEMLGRRPIYITSVALLLAFTGGASAAQNLATLLACRFLAGFFGSAGVAIGAGTLADVWDGDPAQGPASILFILGPFLGPTLAPIASAYTLHDRDNDWRWTQWLVLLIGAPAMVGVVLMSETSVVKPSSEKAQQRISLGSSVRILRTAIARPTRMLFTEIIVASLTLYTAFAYAMIFSYFSSASYVLPRYYGFNIREVGLSFIAVIIGYLLATVLFAVSDKTLYARAAAEARAQGTQPSPKHRLYSAMVGSLLLPVGLFWYAWEAHAGGHWAALVASGIPFGFGAFSLFVSAIAYLVEVYKAGAAASGEYPSPRQS